MIMFPPVLVGLEDLSTMWVSVSNTGRVLLERTDENNIPCVCEPYVIVEVRSTDNLDHITNILVTDFDYYFPDFVSNCFTTSSDKYFGIDIKNYSIDQIGNRIEVGYDKPYIIVECEDLLEYLKGSIL